jgi:hypothetical protein
MGATLHQQVRFTDVLTPDKHDGHKGTNKYLVVRFVFFVNDDVAKSLVAVDRRRQLL